ncbi:hypothetical protein Pedsa_3741 [Pseudopedobacter saltans DSM 12145]|uniref:Uncharacterized protein n=1 Tax=Pseudopedobacter saltans (strain ATCC 51119 / DSM 12145 / JCM 21818 / CCUG 39354 / LMG 10337 / NBRC 100064 / NCIMB 13643) TaxID=762903 RepID=F0S6E4_PSESL|nr:hypothetical protein Pedsa_3741 [Pseudopedobacter saltans DSM 12145]
MSLMSKVNFKNALPLLHEGEGAQRADEGYRSPY